MGQKRELVESEDGQVYGQILKMLGNYDHLIQEMEDAKPFALMDRRDSVTSEVK